MARFTILIILLTVTIPDTALSQSSEWRMALGYGFLSGVDELKDTYRHAAKRSGKDSDIHNLNISIICQPYLEYANGLRIGPGVGPILFLFGDSRHVQIPVNLTVGYSPLKDARFSPYMKAGVSYHIASGDFLENSRPGFLAGVGIEFLNTKKLHLGFETAYDAAEIEIENNPGSSKKDLKAGEWTFFLYADF